jgi:hypothetical protein
MKVNFDSKLLHLDGQVLKNRDADFTLKSAAIEALMNIAESDRTAKGEDKFKRYELAVKVNAGGEVEITPEEATLLKQRIGEVYGPAVIGPAYKLLNG